MRRATPAAALLPRVTPPLTRFVTRAPRFSPCACALVVDWPRAVVVALRLAFVLARLALVAALLRARVPAAFLAVVLRLVCAVLRLVVCVVGMQKRCPVWFRVKRLFALRTAVSGRLGALAAPARVVEALLRRADLVAALRRGRLDLLERAARGVELALGGRLGLLGRAQLGRRDGALLRRGLRLRPP